MAIYRSLPKVSVSPPSYDEVSKQEQKNPKSTATNRKIASILFYSCAITALAFTILAVGFVVCNGVQENCRLWNCLYPSPSKETSATETTKISTQNDLVETQIQTPSVVFRTEFNPKFTLVKILTKSSTPTTTSDVTLYNTTEATPPTEKFRESMVFGDVPNPESGSGSGSDLMNFIVNLPLIRWFFDDYESGEMFDK